MQYQRPRRGWRCGRRVRVKGRLRPGRREGAALLGRPPRWRRRTRLGTGSSVVGIASEGATQRGLRGPSPIPEIQQIVIGIGQRLVFHISRHLLSFASGGGGVSRHPLAHPSPPDPRFALVRAKVVERRTSGGSAAWANGDAGTPLPHSELRRRSAKVLEMLSLAPHRLPTSLVGTDEPMPRVLGLVEFAARRFEDRVLERLLASAPHGAGYKCFATRSLREGISIRYLLTWARRARCSVLGRRQGVALVASLRPCIASH